MRARPAICVLLLAATLLVAGGVRAVEGVSLAIARLDGAGWAAEDLEITLNLFKGTGATLKAARVTLPASAYELRDVHIVCPQLELSSEAIACANARLEMRESPLGPQAAHGRLVYHRRSGAIDLELAELRVAGGAGRLATALTDEGWRKRRSSSCRPAPRVGCCRCRSMRTGRRRPSPRRASMPPSSG